MVPFGRKTRLLERLIILILFGSLVIIMYMLGHSSNDNNALSRHSSAVNTFPFSTSTKSMSLLPTEELDPHLLEKNIDRYNRHLLISLQKAETDLVEIKRGTRVETEDIKEAENEKLYLMKKFTTDKGKILMGAVPMAELELRTTATVARSTPLTYSDTLLAPWIINRGVIDISGPPKWRCVAPEESERYTKNHLFLFGLQNAGVDLFLDIFVGQFANQRVLVHDNLHFFESNTMSNHEGGLPTLQEYLSFFPKPSPDTVTIDINSNYIFYPQSLEAIKCLMPKAKFIVLYNDAMTQAMVEYSKLAKDVLLNQKHITLFSLLQHFAIEYQHAIYCSENYSKKEIWSKCFSQKVWKDEWPEEFAFLGKALYSYQLQAWVEAFGADQVRVYHTDDLMDETTWASIFQFLELSDQFSKEKILRMMNVTSYTGVDTTFLDYGHHFRRNVMDNEVGTKAVLFLQECNLGLQDFRFKSKIEAIKLEEEAGEIRRRK